MKDSVYSSLRSGLLVVLTAGMLAVPMFGLAASPKTALVPAAGDGWRLGVAVVPAARAPGEKVRTTARIEVLVGQMGQGGAPLQAVGAAQAAQQVADGALDAWAGVWPDAGEDTAAPEGVRAVPLAWSASPVAIMRTDTDIHAWSDLSGRTVCLSADGRVTGELSARFGAIEQIYASAADALLALRIGQCDAAVQDEDFMKQLLVFPEWRKFSAQLAPYKTQSLMRLMRNDLSAPLKAAIRQATSPEQLRELAHQQARNIAFEVYLDQTVPDCH